MTYIKHIGKLLQCSGHQTVSLQDKNQQKLGHLIKFIYALTIIVWIHIIYILKIEIMFIDYIIYSINVNKIYFVSQYFLIKYYI